MKRKYIMRFEDSHMIIVKKVLFEGNTLQESLNGPCSFKPVVDGKEYNFSAETEDLAMIIGLVIKHNGINDVCVATKMIARMLNMKTVWNE